MLPLLHFLQEPYYGRGGKVTPDCRLGPSTFPEGLICSCENICSYKNTLSARLQPLNAP